MKRHILWRLIILLFFCWDISCLKIGLYANTGCYSHDVLMIRLGEQLESDHQIVWIQNLIFNFDRRAPHNLSARNWTDLTYNASTQHATDFIRQMQVQLWHDTIPYDRERWHDPRVGLSTFTIHAFQLKGFLEAVDRGRVVERIRAEKLDLLVTDATMQEYATAVADHLQLPLLLVSNYPFIDVHLRSFGVPFNPAALPGSVSDFHSRMTFIERLLNYLLFHATQICFRRFRDTTEAALTAAAMSIDVTRAESRAIGFGSLAEFLIDTPRPLSWKAHYFGCDHCIALSESPTTAVADEFFDRHSCQTDVVLVSFGSIMDGHLMPSEYIDTMITAFRSLPTFTFIWQFGSNFSSDGHASLPKNVRILDWVPLKELLKSNRTKLLISHGGISTCMEAAYMAVPILGVPLHGDQPYNLRRLNEKGAAEIVHSRHFVATFSPTLRKMVKHIALYRQNASKLSRMLKDYNRLFADVGSLQSYWMKWSVRHRSIGRSLHFGVQYQPDSVLYYRDLKLTASLLICSYVIIIASK